MLANSAQQFSIQTDELWLTPEQQEGCHLVKQSVLILFSLKSCVVSGIFEWLNDLFH